MCKRRRTHTCGAHKAHTRHTHKHKVKAPGSDAWEEAFTPHTDEVLVNCLSHKRESQRSTLVSSSGGVCVCVSSCCLRFLFTPPLLPIHDLWPRLNPAVSCSGLYRTTLSVYRLLSLCFSFTPPLSSAAVTLKLFHFCFRQCWKVTSTILRYLYASISISC